MSEIEGERGEHVLHRERVGGMGSVSLREGRSDAHPLPYGRHAIGLHHFHDPDAIKLELVHRHADRDLVDDVRRLEARLRALEQRA